LSLIKDKVKLKSQMEITNKKSESLQVSQTDLKRLAQVVRMGFSTVLVLVIALSAVSLYRLSQFNANMEVIVDVHNRKAALAFGMREAIRQRAISIYSMFTTDDYFERDEELLQFYEYAGDYRRKREELVSLGVDAREQDIHQRLAIITKRSQPANRRTAELLMQEASDKEITASVKHSLSEQKLLLDILDELIELQNQYTEAAVHSNKMEYQFIWILLLSLGIVVLVIGAVIARVVARNVHQKSLEFAIKNEELAVAYQQAEEATKSKSTFLANMSHEIRTPMTGVLGMLDLLKNTELVSEQKHFVNTAYNSAETLLKIINEILDFSKIEAGRVELEEIKFNLRHLVEEVVGLYAKDVQAKDVEIVSYIDNDVPKYVLGDPARLRQILSNLVSNAVKFTHVGEIFVGVKCFNTPGSDMAGMYCFEVIDTGIGISKPAQKKIFGLFTQADESTNRKFGGTGLGLAISEQMTKLFGGEIGVESEEGKGSKFWFTAILKSSERRSVYRKERCFNQLSVYVLTHTRGMNKAITSMLENWGCDVISMINDQKHPPDTPSVDLAILDIDELGRQNITDVYALRKKVINAKKMIGLFRVVEPDVAGKMKHFHLDSSLSRPVRRKPLFTALARLNDKKEKFNPQVKDEQIQFEFDHKECKVLLVDDNVVNQQVEEAILQKCGYLVAVASNGSEALHMAQQGAYDVILMDCQMPVMDGFEATRQIRAYEKDFKKPRIPIIALTANTLEADRKACLAAGMDDFLVKPVRVQALSTIIDRYVFRKAPASIFTSIGELEKAIQGSQKNMSDHFDFKLLDELQGILTTEQFDNVKKSFIENCQQRFNELVLAVSEKNALAIESVAHSLKGSSANLGAKKLSKMSSDIVDSVRRGKIPADIDDLTDEIKAEMVVVAEYFSRSVANC